MDVEAIFIIIFAVENKEWESWTAENHISRQSWQDKVEKLIKTLRVNYSSPAFGLTEREISIFYHKSLKFFYNFILKKLGFPHNRDLI